MNEMELKYGLNPNQKPAAVFRKDGGELPLRVLNGRPGYINLMDALNGWQLVRDLKSALKLPAAASFKHVSPAGAAVGLPLSEELAASCFADNRDGLSPLACAYVRARGADRMSSYGDFIALSDVCDEETAARIRPEVSDGVVAPGYEEGALRILREKKKGAYTILEMDPEYIPPEAEEREIFGLTFRQGRNAYLPDEHILDHIVTKNSDVPENALRDLILSLITLKYTQSNSVVYAFDGQAVGIGAGQQSRVHCVRLAGDKADRFFLRMSAKVRELPFLEGLPRPLRDNAVDQYLGGGQAALLADGTWQTLFSVRPDPFTGEEMRAYLDGLQGVSLGSDAFFPFRDNIERAAESGVRYIVQPGGSVRDDDVIRCCDEYGMAMAMTGMRLFHH